MIPSGEGAAAPPSLLIIEDDPEMLRTLQLFFKTRGFNVAVATNLAQAKTCFSQQPSWRMVISDYHLPDGTGLDLCEWAREQGAVVPPFLLMSGSVQSQALAPGVNFLAKPFGLAELESRIRLLLIEAK